MTPVNAEDLSKALANPLASLISVPIKIDYDENMGANDQGSVWKTTIQPVIPVSLNDEWNIISRTIIPFVSQDDLPVNGAGESGLSDITQSFFFSPVKPTTGGLIWGIGPVLLLPTASDDAVGSEKWGIGPTAVVLKQDGPWTIGGLANHVESFAGEDDRADISATYLQPFLSYITPGKITLGLNTESTYDWEAEEWSVPINFTAAKLVKAGKLPLQLTGGVRYWADAPDNGPEGWGIRGQVTFLFPK